MIIPTRMTLVNNIFGHPIIFKSRTSVSTGNLTGSKHVCRRTVAFIRPADRFAATILARWLSGGAATSTNSTAPSVLSLMDNLDEGSVKGHPMLFRQIDAVRHAAANAFVHA